MYGMICKCDLQRRLGDLDALILLTSCICHDLDHPGFNNIYQVSAQTQMRRQMNHKGQGWNSRKFNKGRRHNITKVKLMRYWSAIASIPFKALSHTARCEATVP
ncbi:High affinity cGMP-specific 3',5'-cyclic phosphodiesterase 9A [Portunus trituberculatus]|uniref:High affinity cGMP-specific 3',5'-cyclic phosphodiesterase 9A n=1 Tax=Portunus trituberculatus TaxID=210409 RepID=A0A5B7ENR5_PORTR|nr:High affinity cGMP-specific 3',5'-cyclic phosphodiesterase 9A [Portunus trituberculatus]